MGSAKKKKLPAKAAKGGKPAAAQRANPFELKGTKRKFSVLGQRDKSDKKNVVASREAAVAKVGCAAVTTVSAAGRRGRRRRRPAAHTPPEQLCPRTHDRPLPRSDSARRRCWWSTGSCARPTRSSTGALEVRRPRPRPLRAPCVCLPVQRRCAKAAAAPRIALASAAWSAHCQGEGQRRAPRPALGRAVASTRHRPAPTPRSAPLRAPLGPSHPHPLDQNPAPQRMTPAWTRRTARWRASRRSACARRGERPSLRSPTPERTPVTAPTAAWVGVRRARRGGLGRETA
jgi:hypothetical protein